jgi:hypothetical protein
MEASNARSKVSGANVADQQFSVEGWLLRYYLWLQTVAGWLLSGTLIAGITGLEERLNTAR